MIDRRQFLRGVLMTSVAAVGVAAATNVSNAASVSGSRSSLGSAESWLLGTGRRALG